jgi:hypothetical protein
LTISTRERFRDNPITIALTCLTTAMAGWALYLAGPPHWTLGSIGAYFLLLLFLSTFVGGAWARARSGPSITSKLPASEVFWLSLASACERAE